MFQQVSRELILLVLTFNIKSSIVILVNAGEDVAFLGQVSAPTPNFIPTLKVKLSNGFIEGLCNVSTGHSFYGYLLGFMKLC